MLDREPAAPHEALEEVSIEHVHVGDYLSLPSEGPSPPRVRCVLVKAAIRTPRVDRVAGWHVELSDGASVCLPRCTKVKRRRFEPAR
jgi:hypothetical protein